MSQRIEGEFHYATRRESDKLFNLHRSDGTLLEFGGVNWAACEVEKLDACARHFIQQGREEAQAGATGDWAASLCRICGELLDPQTFCPHRDGTVSIQKLTERDLHILRLGEKRGREQALRSVNDAANELGEFGAQQHTPVENQHGQIEDEPYWQIDHPLDGSPARALNFSTALCNFRREGEE